MWSQSRRSLWLAAFLLSLTLSIQAEKRDDPQIRQIQQVFESLSDQRLEQTARIAQPPSTAIQSRPQGTGGIAGTVAGLQEMDVLTAWVEAYTYEAGSDGEFSKGIARIEPDGRYQIDGLAPGQYIVLAFAEGYELLYYDNVYDISEATPVTVTADQITEGIDFHMRQWPQGSGSISGQVRDEKGAPIADAAVSCYAPERSYWNTVVTDAQGYYTITALRPADYIVYAWADGYVEQYYHLKDAAWNADPVAVADSSAVTAIDFELRTAGSISGIVTDETGRPLAEVLLYAEPYVDAGGGIDPDGSAFSYGKAMSDENGRYSIINLMEGDYRVRAEFWYSWSYAAVWYDDKYTYEEADKVTVLAGQETPNIDFALSVKEPTGVIYGRVTDSDGDAIPEAFIEIQAADPAGQIPIWISVVTDREGNYRIDRLPNGSYYVSVGISIGWQYFQRWWPNGESLDQATPVVVEDSVPVQIDFTLSLELPKGYIHGQVTDTDGAAIADAYVSLQSAEPENPMPVWASVVTDRQGNYRLEGLPNGSYYVSAGISIAWQYVQRWWPDAESIEGATPVVVDEFIEPSPINFVLPIVTGSASISGYVTNLEGQTLAWASINVAAESSSPDDATGNGVWAWASTDSSGFYSIDQLPEGRYIVHSSHWENLSFGQQWWDHQDSQETANILSLAKDEHRTDIDFTLHLKPVYGSIVGTVTSASGEPLPRAYVSISSIYQDMAMPFMRPFFWGNTWAITDKDGAFAIDWLYEGDYLVAVYADGAFEYYQDAWTVEAAAPVQVRGGEKSVLDFVLQPRDDGDAVIAGRVISEWEKTPFDIAVVTAKPKDGEPGILYTTVTDSLGHFRLAGLPGQGEFVIYAFAGYGVGEYYDNVYDPSQATLVKTNGAEVITLTDIELPTYIWCYDEAGGRDNVSAAQIYGRVIDAAGNGIVGVHIIIFNQAGRAIGAAQTGPGGYYEIGGLAFGNYILQASVEGYNSVFNGNVSAMNLAQPVNVGTNALQVNFVLEPSNITAVDDEQDATVPDVPTLLGNFPNPFNPDTRIAFTLPRAMQVTLTIYNLTGERIATAFTGRLESGRHEVRWDGANYAGERLSSGLYLYKLSGEEMTLTGKMLMLK
ncbi:carboxypeptidase regulatory-like domain-containing protein [candidate division KSB1 bacterium]|nr:carboxypeptidase regulatory-like domain-containing protein [candidate division KSB1 bacterium]